MSPLSWQLVAEKQHALQMDAMQLLYYQAPLSAAILLVAAPILEPIGATLSRSWSATELGMVFGSGVVALFVNLSIYWLLGNTSPLTYPFQWTVLLKSGWNLVDSNFTFYFFFQRYCTGILQCHYHNYCSCLKQFCSHFYHNFVWLFAIFFI